MAFLAPSSMAIATPMSRPPMKIPVILTPDGPREKITSWTSALISSSLTLL
jgi:hypothetical protein